MAASVQLDVTYGTTPGTVVAGVSDISLGNADIYPLVASNNPVAPGNNSYERYVKLHVTDMGGSTKVSNLRVYRSGSALPTGINVKYGQSATYATPVNTASTTATSAISTSLPLSENLYIGGASGGSLTAAGYSDYAVFQAQIDSGASAGGTTTISFVYSEVA